MQESDYIKSKEEITQAIRRNRRMRLKRTNTFNDLTVDDSEKVPFLEQYIFHSIGTTPQAYVGHLETQWYAEQNFRDRRQRNVEYIRGRHLAEQVYDAETHRWMSQYEYLKRRNIPALTYNVVSKLVRSLTGQFWDINTGNIIKCDSHDPRGAELASYLTRCMNRVKNNNKYRKKDSYNFKEMLISGQPVFKQMWGSMGNNKKTDIKFRAVNRSNFMINPGVVDDDLANLHTVTEIHDTSLNDIVRLFANGNYDKGMQIRKAYMNYQGSERVKNSYSSQSFDGSQNRNKSFHYQGTGNSSYRYYEVWTQVSDFEAVTFDPLDGVGIQSTHKFQDPKKVRENIDAVNAERKANLEGESVPENEYMISFKTDFVPRWYVIFITPWGMVLDVRESPYKSGVQPYVFTSPDINGEIWGIVEEVLPAQSSLDRQIQQADAIIANASKGVWLVPNTAIPDSFTEKQYLSEIKKVDGAVVYQVREGYEDQIPKQVHANSSNVSNQVHQLIQLYSNMVDEISGNYGAAQGREANASKTATGYALESQNAGLNVRDMMERFLSMLVDRDNLILQLMLEGYSGKDYESITGEYIDPKELKEYEFNIEQSKGTNSPAHRLALEQELLQLVYNQLLPFEVFMDISNNPIMIQAKQKMEEHKKKAAMQQEAAPGLSQQQLGIEQEQDV